MNAEPGLPLTVDYRPHVPEGYRPGIGIIGVGGIVKSSHLPAYAKFGIPVTAVYDVNPAATEGVVETFGVGRVAESLEELLADPAIEVVDIATFPDARIPLVRQALAAGKHVLSQKPLALDVATARSLVDEADNRGLKLAVNQNGRWSPAWRTTTRLLEAETIGEVVSITHVLDRSFRWTIGTHFEQIPHWAIYDYTVHWIDITRCWMGERAPANVRARDYRTPNQPAESLTPWGLTVEITYEDGANAVIRGTGSEPLTQPEGHPFFVSGTEGRIRGSVLNADFVELQKENATVRYALDGQWFPEGFAGTMGELLSAIAEDREPSNSARHNLRSLELTLAACQSADQDGAPVALPLA
jgi:predicted dehydrogenase